MKPKVCISIRYLFRCSTVPQSEWVARMKPDHIFKMQFRRKSVTRQLVPSRLLVVSGILVKERSIQRKITGKRNRVVQGYIEKEQSQRGRIVGGYNDCVHSEQYGKGEWYRIAQLRVEGWQSLIYSDSAQNEVLWTITLLGGGAAATIAAGGLDQLGLKDYEILPRLVTIGKKIATDVEHSELSMVHEFMSNKCCETIFILMLNYYSQPTRFIPVL